MTFDFRGHGKNNEGQYCTFGRDEALDVIAAVKFIKSDPELQKLPLFVYGFSMLGNASNGIIDEQQERCLWTIGATLFSYMVAFMGVNLFDQMRLLWFMLLAIISVATAPVLVTAKKLSSGAN